jgi:hypothetical protein
MFFHHSSNEKIDLLFDLITIKNSFILTPIHPDAIQILPTALSNNLNSSMRTKSFMNQLHFGYCSLDRTSTNRIILTLENNPQTCVLPLIGM